MAKCRKWLTEYYSWIILGGVFLLLLFLNAFYLENWLDSDMAAEMMFSKLLAEEGRVFASPDWYYTTEFRFLYTHLVMAPLFRICSDWHTIRMLTNVIFYLLLLCSWFYMAAKLPVGRNKKILGGAVLLLPFSETLMLHMEMGNTYISHVIILFFGLGLFLRLAQGGDFWGKKTEKNELRGEFRETEKKEYLEEFKEAGKKEYQEEVRKTGEKECQEEFKETRGKEGQNKYQKKVRQAVLWVLYALLSVICGVSGIRYMLALQGPVVLASIWYIVQSSEFQALRHAVAKEQFRLTFSGLRLRFLVTGLIGACCCILGYGINIFYVSRAYTFQTYEATNFIDVYQGVFWERLQDAFGSLLMLFGYIPGKSVLSLRGIVTLASFLLLALLGYCAVKAAKTKEPVRHFFVLLFYSSFLLNSFVFVFTNSTLVPRYYITTMVLAVPVAAVWFEEEKKPLDRIFTAALLAFCLLLGTAKTSLSMMTTDKNQEKRAAAEKLTELGYTFGYATYWNGNIMQELSNGMIELASIYMGSAEDITLFQWASMARYYEPEYHPGGVFLLLTEGEEEQLKGSSVLKAGEKVCEVSGYVIYDYSSNREFLDALHQT